MDFHVLWNMPYQPGLTNKSYPPKYTTADVREQLAITSPKPLFNHLCMCPASWILLTWLQRRLEGVCKSLRQRRWCWLGGSGSEGHAAGKAPWTGSEEWLQGHQELSGSAKNHREKSGMKQGLGPGQHHYCAVEASLKATHRSQLKWCWEH